MNFLFVFSVIFFVNISIGFTSASSSGVENFLTGPNYWNANQSQSRLTAGEYRLKHAQFVEGDKWQIFKSTLEMHENKQIRCPIKFTLNNCIESDLSLSFRVDPFGAAQLKVFLAFNEAMVELIDTEQDLIQNSKYIHADLELIKSFYQQSLVFIKKAEDLCLSTLDNKKPGFAEKDVLDNLTYTDAEKINAGLIGLGNEVRSHQA